MNGVRPSDCRRGVALFAALAFLVLLGLLVTAGIATTLISGRSNRFAELGASLDAATDYVLSTVLAAPDSFALATLPYGVPTSFDVPVPGLPPRRATVTATRIAGNLVWLVAEAVSTGPDRGARRVSAIARFRSIGALPPAPIVARAAVSLGLDVHVDVDTASDADCGVVAPLSAPTAVSSDAAAYFLDPRQLARLDSAGRITHVHHDTTLGPGNIQGIVIADGAVSIVGPTTVDGLLVAQGRISAPVGLSLFGAMMSFDTTSTPILLDHSSVRYSPCEVARQLRRVMPMQRVRVRGWAELM